MGEPTKVWLYKARDVAASGEPRPDADRTRAFAFEDGILCRSAYTRAGDRSAWIPNVQNVDAGDILLLFFRQIAAQPSILFLGSFRVREPGDTRLNEDCDLAVVKDPGVEERLRAAYGIPLDEPVTGWLLSISGRTRSSKRSPPTTTTNRACSRVRRDDDPRAAPPVTQRWTSATPSGRASGG